LEWVYYIANLQAQGLFI